MKDHAGGIIDKFLFFYIPYPFLYQSFLRNQSCSRQAPYARQAGSNPAPATSLKGKFILTDWKDGHTLTDHKGPDGTGERRSVPVI